MLHFVLYPRSVRHHNARTRNESRLSRREFIRERVLVYITVVLQFILSLQNVISAVSPLVDSLVGSSSVLARQSEIGIVEIVESVVLSLPYFVVISPIARVASERNPRLVAFRVDFFDYVHELFGGVRNGQAVLLELARIVEYSHVTAAVRQVVIMPVRGFKPAEESLIVLLGYRLRFVFIFRRQNVVERFEIGIEVRGKGVRHIEVDAVGLGVFGYRIRIYSTVRRVSERNFVFGIGFLELGYYLVEIIQAETAFPIVEIDNLLTRSVAARVVRPRAVITADESRDRASRQNYRANLFKLFHIKLLFVYSFIPPRETFVVRALLKIVNSNIGGIAAIKYAAYNTS